MLQWIPCELHTHTINSDGSLSLLKLAQQAKKLGLECIALTDHNTISGHLDIPYVMKETGLQIVHGMEWTTFYGHMVAMGIKKYVDWRNRVPSDIHEGIADIHEVGGLAGVAHPYRMGSPMCTGCYWQFQVKDWNEVDYLEVWSQTFPSINPVNKRAFKLWTDLLNQGYKLTAVSGRDWHGGENDSDPIAVTFLGIDKDDTGDFEKKIMMAITYGRAVSTMGPLMNLCIQTKGNKQKYRVGDVIESDEKEKDVEIIVDIDFYVRSKHWQIDSQPLKVVLMGNIGKIAELLISQEIGNAVHTLEGQELEWVRAELYGTISGVQCMIAYTNPIYFTSVKNKVSKVRK